MNKLTVKYISALCEDEKSLLTLQLTYNDEPPRTCTYVYNKPWCGWEYIDGDSEPNMSPKIRYFWDSTEGDYLIETVLKYECEMSIEL